MSPVPALGRLFISRRAAKVAPFFVMQVMRDAFAKEAVLAAEGCNSPSQRVLHLEMGQPGGAPPTPVVEATARALRSEKLGYTAEKGLLSLREAVAKMYMDRYGVPIDSASVGMTTGSSGAFVAIFAAAFEVGDRVAVAVPGYPCYRNTLTALGIQVVQMPVDAHDNYQPTVRHLELAIKEHGALAGLIVASPSNPTGTVLTRERLTDLSAFCESKGMRFIADEIYHGITRSPAPTALAHSPNAVVISSFSKYWAMTGYRIGWLISRDAALNDAVGRLLQNLCISAPTLSQHAALAALDPACAPELDAKVAMYFRNIDHIVSTLERTGFSNLYRPEGSFFVYVGVRDLCAAVDAKGSVHLCNMILEDTAVALVPGIDFDPARGHDFVRFSASGPEEDIIMACDRISSWVSRKTKRQS